MLLLILLLQQFQLVLLLLQPLLDDLSPRNNAFLQLLHHVRLYLDSQIQTVYWIVGVQPSFLEVGLQVIVLVAFVFDFLVFVAIFFKFLAGLVVEGLVDSQNSKAYLFVLFRNSAFLVPDDLVAFFLFGE